MGTSVVFRRAALQDVQQYEAWRVARNPEWRPIATDLLTAIHTAVARVPSFAAIPAPFLVVRGEVRPLKRVQVVVRSKPFKVCGGPGRTRDQILVRRKRHPRNRSLEP